MRLSMLLFVCVVVGMLTISVGCSRQPKKAEIPENFDPPPKDPPTGFEVKPPPK